MNTNELDMLDERLQNDMRELLGKYRNDAILLGCEYPGKRMVAQLAVVSSDVIRNIVEEEKSYSTETANDLVNVLVEHMDDLVYSN